MVTRGKLKPAARRTRSAKTRLAPARQAKTPVRRSAQTTQNAEERIRRKAFELYELRGGVPGFDQFDWSVAATIISLEDKAKAAKAKAAAPQNLDDDIQKKAYELFERRGHAHGQNELDWTLARQMVYLENRLPLS